jgi:ribosome biogenesis GTPase A
MAKTRRMLAEQLKAVDVVVLLVDARAPLASSNPDFDELFAQKPRVLVLNKADLADPPITRAWVDRFTALGINALPFSAGAQKGVKPAVDAVTAAAAPVVERARARGIKKVVRAMVAGIPNVGKSTFINRLKGSAAAKAGDTPGVTRGRQWIRLSPYLEFLDTPGMLWPKLEDQDAARVLAFLGAIRSEVTDEYALAKALVRVLRHERPQALRERLKLERLDADDDIVMEEACKARGWLMQGGGMDLMRGAQLLLDEFRAGKMGRISLEAPPQAP